MRPAGKIMRSFGRAIGIKLFAAVFSYVSFVLLNRWLPAEEFGKLAFGFSLAMVVGIVGGGGQRTLALRFLGAYRGQHRPDLARGLIRYSGGWTLVAAVVAVSGICGAALVLPGHGYLWPSAVLAAALIFSEYTSFALRGLGYLSQALVPKHVIWRPLALIGIVLVGTDVLQTANAGLWWLAGSLWAITLIQFFWVFRPAIDFARSGRIKGESRESLSEVEVWRPSARKYWATAAFGPSFQHLTVLAMGLVLNDVDTGIYFAVLRTAGTLTFLLQAVNMVVAPRISSAHARDETGAIQKLVTLSAVLSFSVAAAAFILFIVFGGPILGLFDPDYATYTDALVIMAAGFLITAGCGPSAQLLTMTGHEGANLKQLLVSNFLGLSVMFILAISMGITGASIGFALGLAIRNTWATYYARNKLGIDASILALILPPKRIS